MLDVVPGQKRNVFGVVELRDALTRLGLNGTLYIGYPIIATADEPVVIEALLTCREHGIVVFDLQGAGRSPDGWEALADRQNDLYAGLYQKLLSYRPLRTGRSLGVDLHVVSLLPAKVGKPSTADDEALAVTAQELPGVLRKFAPVSADQLRLINAAIQRITTIKPANKRPTATRKGSRGEIMRQIEAAIANLDQWQKGAAIETPDGPQRVRGLAGSGKTVVLALKAAYLHSQNPDWDIAVTFSTRALRAQIVDLIRRFSFEHMNDEPDWTKLRVLQSWGSSKSPGVYSEIARANEIPYYDFIDARQKFGYDDAFRGACDELLKAAKEKKRPRQIFDAILIDEAQDLPQPFFELCYHSTRNPKRLVYAYDELQNISANGYTVAPPAELFGVDSRGKPNVPTLSNIPNEPRQDIMLPVCYRNTPWALTTAHAVGFGIYKTEGLVQYFDNPELWSDVGYEIVEGELELGHDVVLARRSNSYPEYFTDLLKAKDAVVAQVFEDEGDQAKWVADEIAKNISEDELDLRDVLVIMSNPVKAREDSAAVIAALDDRGIPAHLAGVTASVDQLFQDDSVAISGIYRAKGNEAPMVYILNSDYCVGSFGSDAIRRRNILFTAITRSRAWVRILGTGDRMSKLKQEIDQVAAHKHRLAFRVPTEKELARMRRIQRDISQKEIATIKKAERSIEDLLALIEAGTIDRANLPPELLERLAALSKDADDSDE